MCVATSAKVLLVAVFCTLLSFVVAQSRWGAYRTDQVTTNDFDKSTAFGTLDSFLTSAQTSPGDKALILVNGDYFRKGSSYKTLNFDINAIAATTTDLGGSQYFAALQNNDARECQPINFMYLDTAPAASVQYMANVNGAGKLSHLMQDRCFDVAVFPSTYSIASSALTAAVLMSSVDTSYSAWSGDVTVTLASATDRVLLLVSVPFSTALANANAAFTIYKGGPSGSIAAPNLIVQTIGGIDANAARQVTGAYVDSPGTTGTITYTGMVRKLTTYVGASADFSLSKGSTTYRSLIAIVVPNSCIGHAQITNEYLVTSPTWETVPGLSVPSAGYAASDYVMIVVNINYYCTSGSSATGYFTVFQDDLPLPGHNGTTGMHIVRIIRRNETVAASMTTIVSPGTTSTVTFSVKVRVTNGAFLVGGYGQTSSITVVTQPQFTGTTPTANPTAAPSRPTAVPTAGPTVAPTVAPSVSPTAAPSEVPTCNPTAAPSTLTPSRSPTVAPTLEPTVGPSKSPSATPTWAPTAPTVTPTAMPTAVPAICSVSCTFGGQYYASPRYFVQNVAQLPPSFVVEFDAKIPRVLSGGEASGSPIAVLEFVNQATQSVLLAVRMTTSTGIALVYNDIVVDDFSVNFKSSLAQLTHFKITLTSNNLLATSSADNTWVDNHPLSSLVDTSNQIYSLYVNAPASTMVEVDNIVITGEYTTEYQLTR
jgi:hypothetical protein